MSMDPNTLKKTLGSGLLAFPVTHFKPDLSFDEQPYRSSIHRNVEHGAVGLFAPGGTGEFFSLTLAEAERVTRAAVEEAKGRVPIVGGTGYGTAMAVEFAKAAERAGADAVLVLPPYLLGVEQAGLEAHVDAICRAIGIGVIVYNRDNAIYCGRDRRPPCRPPPQHDRLQGRPRRRRAAGARAPDRRRPPRLHRRHADGGGVRGALLRGGLHDLLLRRLQFPARDGDAVLQRPCAPGERATTDRLLKSLFLPYVALRNRRKGYAVSIVKAGLRVVGRSAGPVRPPLVDLTADEQNELARMVQLAQA